MSATSDHNNVRHVCNDLIPLPKSRTLILKMMIWVWSSNLVPRLVHGDSMNIVLLRSTERKAMAGLILQLIKRMRRTWKTGLGACSLKFVAKLSRKVHNQARN